MIPCLAYLLTPPDMRALILEFRCAARRTYALRFSASVFAVSAMRGSSGRLMTPTRKISGCAANRGHARRRRWSAGSERDRCSSAFPYRTSDCRQPDACAPLVAVTESASPSPCSHRMNRFSPGSVKWRTRLPSLPDSHRSSRSRLRICAARGPAKCQRRTLQSMHVRQDATLLVSYSVKPIGSNTGAARRPRLMSPLPLISSASKARSRSNIWTPISPARWS